MINMCVVFTRQIAFDNSKKIDLLNEDITNVLMAPPKAAASGDIVKQVNTVFLTQIITNK